jgi:hypothetical protein
MRSGLQPVETSVLFGDLVGAADVVVYPEVGLLQTHLENFTEVLYATTNYFYLFCVNKSCKCIRNPVSHDI